METMISVDRAINLIKEHVVALKAVDLSLDKANGLVLTKEVIATNHFPSFLQSNMDGYAFAFEQGRTEYILVGEVAAGENKIIDLQKGTATRIFTGAPLPTGADTVLIQEKARVNDGILQVLDEALQMGMHTRPIGSEIMKGAQAIEKGICLKPNVIGFLAGIGVDSVEVCPNPKVGIIITGNELQNPGVPLAHGQVYESNSYSLKAALSQIDIQDVTILQIKDDLHLLSKGLEQMLEQVDLVLMTGGVSVGDYDFTCKAFEACGIQTIFHKIKQKPGKPLLFGKKREKIIFGLPGNPASVLTCFYEYVLLAIQLQTNRTLVLNSLEVPMQNEFNKTEGLTHFMKGMYDQKGVQIITGQESYKLHSFAKANCLVLVPESTTHLHIGDQVKIHLLP